jgi:hypothetical protein
MHRHLPRRALAVVIVSAAMGLAAQQGPANAVTEHTVSGVVLGDGQKPLPGATVTITGNQSVHAVTDNSGQYKIAVADGSYAANFAAPGYTPAEFAEKLHSSGQFTIAGHDVDDVSAQLTRPATVTGRVTVAGKGAVVSVEGDAAAAGKDFSDWSAPDGSFRFTNVTPGTYYIGFRPPSDDYDFATVGPVVVGSGKTVTVPTTSMPAKSGYGRIQATVDADRASNTAGYAEFGAYSSKNPVHPARTDYVIDPPAQLEATELVPGHYKIALDSNTWIGGRSFLSASSFTVTAGHTTKVAGIAHGGVDVVMQILNERGESLNDIQAIVRRAGDPTELVSLTTSHSSPDDGFVQVEGLRAGTYVVSLLDPRGEYADQTITSTFDGVPAFGGQQVVTMKRKVALPPVTHHDGSASVTMDRAGGVQPEGLAFYRYDDDAAQVSTTDTSAPDGQVTYSLEPGKYRIKLGPNVWYGGPTFATATVVDLAPSQLTTLTGPGLAPFGWVRGWVHDDAHRPVDDVWVTAYAADDPTQKIATASVSSQFSMDELPVRAYKLRITDPSGRYPSTWIGGGSKFATAKSWVPDLFPGPVAGRHGADPAAPPGDFTGHHGHHCGWPSSALGDPGLLEAGVGVETVVPRRSRDQSRNRRALPPGRGGRWSAHHGAGDREQVRVRIRVGDFSTHREDWPLIGDGLRQAAAARAAVRTVLVEPSSQTRSPVRSGRVSSQRAASAPWAYAAVASMSAQVIDAVITVTEATPVGVRPVRASTRCRPRWVVPDVATAPLVIGSTAINRLGSRGSSMPIRQPTEPAARLRHTMSPPAERQKSVPARGSRSSVARSIAQPFTTPLGSSWREPPAPGSEMSNAPELSTRARSAIASTSSTSGDTSWIARVPWLRREISESSR